MSKIDNTSIEHFRTFDLTHLLSGQVDKFSSHLLQFPLGVHRLLRKNSAQQPPGDASRCITSGAARSQRHELF